MVCTFGNWLSQLNYHLLIFLVTPVFREISSSASININESLTLSCVAVGFPALSIAWTKNGKPFEAANITGVSINTLPFANVTEVDLSHLDNTHSIQFIGYVGLLQFSSVERSDTAEYSCIASNGPFPDEVSDEINVTVLGKKIPLCRIGIIVTTILTL